MSQTRSLTHRLPHHYSTTFFLQPLLHWKIDEFLFQSIFRTHSDLSIFRSIHRYTFTSHIHAHTHTTTNSKLRWECVRLRNIDIDTSVITLSRNFDSNVFALYTFCVQDLTTLIVIVSISYFKFCFGFDWGMRIFFWWGISFLIDFLYFSLKFLMFVND